MKKAISSYKAKTLREDAHSRELKYVACATTLSARVSQAKLFVLKVLMFPWEETGPFFTGDRTAKQVAASLQSRVQLYLDERN